MYANGVYFSLAGTLMEFVEAPAFSRHLAKYLDDDRYRQLQVELALEPERGNVMPGTGGFRKLRWQDSRRGKGRRGGLRVVYYYFPSDSQIWLVTIYDKDEAADLTAVQKKALKNAIELEAERRAVDETRTRRKH